MTNSIINLVAHLKERIAEMSVPAPTGSFLASPLFQMVLRGDAKLPLDRVEEVASVIGVDVPQLFRRHVGEENDWLEITASRQTGLPGRVFPSMGCCWGTRPSQHTVP